VIDVRRAALAVTTGLALGAGCRALADERRPVTAGGQVTPPVEQIALTDLIGGWRWMHRADEEGTSRIEDERWRFRPDPDHPATLLGTYLRSVEVRSLDRVPFQCNQRPLYVQRARYDVTATVDPSSGTFVVHETAYATEPSPCDHGFRHLGDYRAHPIGNRLTLDWDGGSQTLWQIDDAIAPLPGSPWSTDAPPDGSWRWDATSIDPDGNVRDESEWWQITARTPTRFDATYRRRVSVHSRDGSPITCASAPSWQFDDVYALEGQKEEDHWRMFERAVDPGDHPCLRATPRRSFDEATGEVLGGYFVLEWRGKRHQVLYRPDAT